MNRDEALSIIESALQKTRKNDVKMISRGNLLTEGCLDSIESFMFSINLKKVSGLKMPRAKDLNIDFFDIENLSSYLIEKSKTEATISTA